MEINRRVLASAVGIAAVGAALEGCSATQNAAIQQDIANAIGEVQSFVTSACSAYGKVVATAPTIFALLTSIAGAPGAAIAAGGQIALQAGQMIAAAVCSAAPAPTAGPLDVTAALAPRPAVVVTPGPGKSPVNINFL